MKRNPFDLSHKKLFSCDMGELIPCGLTEVLPGDTFKHNTNMFLRLAAMASPVMHKCTVHIKHWFVPSRLIWADFEDFITRGPLGTSAPTHPTITISYAAGPPATGSGVVGGLADYLGVPPGINNLVVNALPFRAYALIFNENYRDQDLVSEVGFSTASGSDSTTNTALLNVAWQKDYFTSARPWAQKGATVSLPLSGNAPVKGIGVVNPAGGTPASIANVNEHGSTTTYPAGLTLAQLGITEGKVKMSSTNPASAYIDIYADLSNVTAATVTQLRIAMAVQRFQENRARYGSRFTEYLRSSFGVISSDARLQRPEYLGGGKAVVQFSEVLATADGGDSEVGDLYGHGIGAARSNRYMRHFEEHGFVVTLMSVLPETVYVQGLFRHWNRRTYLDYFQPELQHVGQQAVLKKEIYAASADPDGTFGYQDKNDDYRRAESSVAGEFRTTVLDDWHMARIFASEPSLNSAFVTADPTKRIFRVQDNDVLYCEARHSLRARRKIAPIGSSFIM